MNVRDLPSITVTSIEPCDEGHSVRGQFDRLDRIRESGWLWPGPAAYVFCDELVVDRNTREATFKVTDPEQVGCLSIGSRYPWFDGYWQVPVVQAIIDEQRVWKRIEFKASDAQHFRVGSASGWQEAGGRLPQGAVPTHVEPGGWDHEHCNLCLESIDARNPVAFVDDEGWRLCESCHDRYAAKHSVAFQLGG